MKDSKYTANLDDDESTPAFPPSEKIFPPIMPTIRRRQGDPDPEQVRALQERIGELEAQLSNSGGALVLTEDVVDLGMFHLTPVGLRIADAATQADVKLIGDVLFRIQTSIQWLIGDWINAMGYETETEIREVAAQYGRSYRTLQNWKSISNNVPYEIRTAALDYHHHIAVASLPIDQQQYWLQRATEGDVMPKTGLSQRWSVSRLRAEIAGQVLLPRPVKRKQQREYKQRFNRILEAVSNEAPPNLDDISALKKWLTELEKHAKT